MRFKFLLTLLTTGTLLAIGNNTNATTNTPNRSTELGASIAKLTDIDRPDLIVTAIERALLAQQQQPTPALPRTAGVPLAVPSQAEPTLQPKVRGRVAKPKQNPTSTTTIERQDPNNSTKEVDRDLTN
jgi:hypothetical protein